MKHEQEFELTSNQLELINDFYSRPLTRIALVKAERDSLWKQFKKNKSYSPDFGLEIRSPALKHELDKAIDANRNIQPAVFSECVYAQCLAEIFDLKDFEVYTSTNTSVPLDIKAKLTKHGFAPRYVYRNADSTQFLIQAGGFGGVDSALISVSKEDFFTIEFKEPGAKLSEPDLPKYGEDGLIISDAAFRAKYPQYLPMLDEQIEKRLNIFQRAGSNINDFEIQNIEHAVFQNYGSVKPADVICIEDREGFLTMIPSHHGSIWARLEGEIRPGGRNNYKVWTPLRLKSLIASLQGTIDGVEVSIEVTKLKIAKARGSDEASRYKLDPIFFVRFEDVTIQGTTAKFDLKSVRQNKATIAGKMFFDDLVAEQVKSHYLDR